MMKSGWRVRVGLLGAIALGAVSDGTRAGEILVPQDARWHYFKGREEASRPVDAWRGVDFDDSAWATGPAPFHYGESGVHGGTVLDDMRYHYTTLFLRHTFTLADVEEIGGLTLRAAVDDGFIAWINGREIARYRVNSGERAFDDTANSNAPEPVQFASYTALNQPGWLREGANVLAVQVFNVRKTSSDLQFHGELSMARIDHEPPAVLTVSPAPGAVGKLGQLTVTFSEAVTGLDAEDLLINGIPARSVTARGAAYTFTFPRPPYGEVTVSWEPAHGITDLGTPPNPFVPAAPWAEWHYTLSDSLPPRIVWVHPPPDRAVRALTEVEALFSEPVTGVDAADLLVNGQPATNVTGILAGPYRFTFAPAAPGAATLAWAAEHGITDFGDPPNPFAGGTWTIPVKPDRPVARVEISEFLAANLSGLKDEDGEPQDWIELWNRGDTPADLTGWSLTDDADRPGKWVFPAVRLNPGRRLVVFASGKDRRVPGAPLHTNFKLGGNGEYLGLFTHEQPRQALSEFAPRYPAQRNDYSYGLTPAGEWRYFADPTPGAANGDSAIVGVTPKVRFSVKRGFASAPFDLALTCDQPDAVIRYTLDGSEPTERAGAVYTAPLRIERTRVVRAAAFAPHRLPSRVKTHTYLFVADLLRQPDLPEGFPAQWGSSKITRGDYAMDPRIVDSPRYRDRARAGLTSIPALSLVMSIEDWFSPDRGIYSNGQREGIAWERAGSMEFFTADGRESFQENCGLRIQGGSSTQPWKSYKLSMRTTFRSDYGAAWLNQHLFPDSPVDRFDTLIVDAGLNYVWTYGGGVSPDTQRERAKYVADQFASDLQEASGGVAVHGRFVNVFINGVYWGLHNFHEEPEAAFGATYWGGSKDDYDVIKHTGNHVLDGNGAAWDAMMTAVRRDLSDPAHYAAVQQWLDLPAFIDYMLVHFYIGDTDWPHHNWYALRKREPGAKWYFVSWDSEHSLERLDHNRVGVDNANTCAEIYAQLRANPEFRLLFADRVHRHFFNGGIYYVDPGAPQWDPAHPERNRPAALYNRRVAEIDTALVSESARWGDNQRPGQPYTRDEEYETTLRWLNETYFPQRSAIVLDQLRRAGLYPRVAAPVLSQHGGRVEAGFPLAMRAPEGTIWFTTDGSDPRQAGTGAVSPTATAYPGEPLELTHDTWLKARTLADGTWSALTEARFQAPGLDLTLTPTEIMYHPAGGGAYEFLELVNLGEWALDLTEFTFTGIDYVFPPGSVVQPGEPFLLVSDRDPAAFAARYPGVTPDGYYGGGLSDGGETLALKDRRGRLVWQVTYDDKGAWPKAADGDGYSLERARLAGGLSEPATWRESAQPGGSPGVWNGPPLVPPIRLNEISSAGTPDFIELRNAGEQPADLSGWTLRDDGNADPFVFPADTILPAGGYLVVWCGDPPSGGFHAPFGLNRDAETVVLRDAGGRTVDALSLGHQMPGLTVGRLDAAWAFCAPTPAAANRAAPLADPTELRLNEWFVNPLPGEDDWVELFNPAARPVPLTGLRLVTDTAEATLRALALVEPRGFALLLADRRDTPGHLPLKFPAAGGGIRLFAPDGAAVDAITYPATPENVALGRLPDGAGAPRPLAAITPGAPNSNDPADSDRDRDGLPDVWETAHGLNPGSAKGDDGAKGDPDGDGRTNLEEWRTGGDPQTPDAPWRLAWERAADGGWLLRFTQPQGRVVRLETRAALGAGAWQVEQELPAPETPREVALPLPAPPDGATRFYRLAMP